MFYNKRGESVFLLCTSQKTAGILCLEAIFLKMGTVTNWSMPRGQRPRWWGKHKPYALSLGMFSLEKRRHSGGHGCCFHVCVEFSWCRGSERIRFKSWSVPLCGSGQGPNFSKSFMITPGIWQMISKHESLSSVPSVPIRV